MDSKGNLSNNASTSSHVLFLSSFQSNSVHMYLRINFPLSFCFDFIFARKHPARQEGRSSVELALYPYAAPRNLSLTPPKFHGTLAVCSQEKASTLGDSCTHISRI